MKQKILIVDDEASIVTLLSYHIEKAGYMINTARDGEEALRKAKLYDYALIVLDVMLPKKDGMEVCKQLRDDHIDTPILMLTARDEENNKLLGLELGADDYLTKPFSPKEVVARIKAILRRVTTHPGKERKDTSIQIGDLTVYPERYEAEINKETITFTRKEFELLSYLIMNKERILSRSHLLNKVWNYDFAGYTRIVDVHISRLRDKIETDTRNPLYIKTMRGLGYKMEDPTL